ncbi:MAG: hypothetical protein ACK56I_19280, partial [bacterium]
VVGELVGAGGAGVGAVGRGAAFGLLDVRGLHTLQAVAGVDVAGGVPAGLHAPALLVEDALDLAVGVAVEGRVGLHAVGGAVEGRDAAALTLVQALEGRARRGGAALFDLGADIAALQGLLSVAAGEGGEADEAEDGEQGAVGGGDGHRGLAPVARKPGAQGHGQSSSMRGHRNRLPPPPA